MINICMLNNKYYRLYYSIVNTAQKANRKKGQGIYYENHHILPKSLGGSNHKSNLVLLTPKEHFVCHHLLTKFVIGENKSKMLFAFWNLANSCGKFRPNQKIYSKTYAVLKERVAALVSELNKGRKVEVTESTKEKIRQTKLGDKNPNYGKPAHNRGQKRPGVGGRPKGTKWSDETRKKMSEIRSQPGYYDHLSSPDRAEKIRQKHLGKTGSAKDKYWYNNGERETYQFTCPEGYVKGRLPKSLEAKRGMLWYNNGIDNKQYKEGQELEGYVRGRIKTKQ